MNSGNDFIKKLRSDVLYRQALGRARTPEERKAIASMVEGMVGSIGDVLGPLIDKARQDPEFAKQLGRALAEGGGVLNDVPTKASGSNG